MAKKSSGKKEPKKSDIEKILEINTEVTRALLDTSNSVGVLIHNTIAYFGKLNDLDSINKFMGEIPGRIKVLVDSHLNKFDVLYRKHFPPEEEE